MQQTLLQQRDYVPSREFTRRMLARFRLRGSTFSGVRLAALVLDPSVAARLQGAGNSAFPGLTGPKILGYRPWTHQMTIRTTRGKFSVARAAVMLAEELRRAYDELRQTTCIPDVWRLGDGGITFDQIFLVEMFQARTMAIVEEITVSKDDGALATSSKDTSTPFMDFHPRAYNKRKRIDEDDETELHLELKHLIKRRRTEGPESIGDMFKICSDIIARLFRRPAAAAENHEDHVESTQPVAAAEDNKDHAESSQPVAAVEDTKDHAESSQSVAVVEAHEDHVGSTMTLTDLPLDILLQIFSFLDPGDLLILARTNKPFRSTLMHRESRSIWTAAIAETPYLPPCPEWLTEPQYADLAFGEQCYLCGTKVFKPRRWTYWEYNVRYCGYCSAQMKHLGRLSRNVYYGHLLPVNLELKGDGHYIYHKPDLERIKIELKEAWAVHVDKCNELIVKYMAECEKIMPPVYQAVFIANLAPRDRHTMAYWSISPLFHL
ncbi:predicted protein [Postia placenta Mad-698-R]|nr:predicted protein [Postia placenta Mad-698-R]